MSDRNKFSLAKRFKSFKYAFRGLATLIKEEHNLRVHIFAAFLVTVFGIIYDISASEWILITICVGMVVSAEIFNSAIEKIADRITREHDERIGKIKDIAAAGVLVTAVVSVIAGLMIFLPKF